MPQPDETVDGGDHRRASVHRSCYGSRRTYVADNDVDPGCAQVARLALVAGEHP